MKEKLCYQILVMEASGLLCAAAAEMILNDVACMKKKKHKRAKQNKTTQGELKEGPFAYL